MLHATRAGAGVNGNDGNRENATGLGRMGMNSALTKQSRYG